LGAAEQAAQIVDGGSVDLTMATRLVEQLRSDDEAGAIALMLRELARRALYAGWEAGSRSRFVQLLSDNQEFGYARRLLGRLRDAGDDSAALRERLAFCTYKDRELPAAPRLDAALRILGGDQALESTSAETLGLAGAIYKRKWEIEAKRADIERSLTCYEKGFSLAGDRGFTGINVAGDRGFTGINAAYVSDILADLESKGFGASGRGDELRSRADEIRRSLVEELGEGTTMWDNATLGEAYLGLGRLDEACRQLTLFREQQPTLWQTETAAMQLASLARLRDIPDDDSAKALRCLVGDREGAIRRAQIGKVGVALSGGGFRASLFHLGVLARLADCDLLRHVEVLSCVSGGSIVGAFYYLKLRDLLHGKADTSISRTDYQNVVGDTITEFLAGVQSNIRVRLTASPAGNVRMLSGRSSRTERAAELFEQTFYGPLRENDGSPWLMRDLRMKPFGRGDGFSLRYENWLRSAKVPMLVLNATTLNTGHDWQFTASWMGEPPSQFEEPLDASRRLRRVYYPEAPKPHCKQTLASAVAASACVPGIFTPIELRGLYEGDDHGELAVELVDGGVHDNQGIASLLEQDCTIVLVSDASGQIRDSDRAERNILGVAKRSNTVLMSRVRELEFGELLSRRRSGTLRGLMFVHMKKGLSAEPRDWIGCKEPYEASDDILAPLGRDGLRDYRIAPGNQRALSELRTDLDSFSDEEALSLMAAGYTMARCELEDAIPGSSQRSEQADPLRWPFDEMLDKLESDDEGLLETLHAGRARFLRPIVAWRDHRQEHPGAVARLLAGKRMQRIERGARAVADKGVVKPVRTVLAAPVALVGALATRAALSRRK
jgi:predicted acylesterase/phospholipase RssA